MTVDKAIEIIDNYIDDFVARYKLTDESLDDEGVYKPHYLESLTVEQKLFALDESLKYTAIVTVPTKLLETDGSTATPYRRVSQTKYIRVPNTPEEGAELDVDEPLAYGVVYNALSILDDEFSTHSRTASSIYSAYNEAYRDREINTSSLFEPNSVSILFRFSPDGTNDWTDTFKEGDRYISFKNGDTWSSAVKFVGEDGDAGTGGGSSTFAGLTDTPETLEAEKYLKVNADGNALEFVDAPNGVGNTDFDRLSGNWDVQGTIYADFRYDSGHNKATHYYMVDGDLTLRFTKHLKDDGYEYLDLELGRKYIVYFFHNNHSVTIDFDSGLGTVVHGDETIDTSGAVALIEFMYDGLDIYILRNISYAS